MKTTTAPEREVMRACQAVFRLYGLSVHRQNTGAMKNASGRLVRFGRKGAADWSGTLPGGRRFELECKREGKRPTPEQYRRMHEVNALGGVAFWCDSAAYLAKALPVILAGGRVEIREDGEPIFHAKGS